MANSKNSLIPTQGITVVKAADTAISDVDPTFNDVPGLIATMPDNNGSTLCHFSVQWTGGTVDRLNNFRTNNDGVFSNQMLAATLVAGRMNHIDLWVLVENNGQDVALQVNQTVAASITISGTSGTKASFIELFHFGA